MNEFCEQEIVVGNTTCYCLLREHHVCDCIFADPKLIEIMAAKNDQVFTKKEFVN